MYPTEMHEMSFWKLVENSPEWVTVFTTALFAFVTTFIIWRQKCVMEQQVSVMQRQGQVSARHEEHQNNLIRLQHEHDWLIQKNKQREELLSLVRKVYRRAAQLKSKPQTSDSINWHELQNTLYDLDARLNILDFASFTGDSDLWFKKLMDYRDAMLQAVLED